MRPTQGNVQRIMYLHVPSVWVAYLAFGVVLVASIAYLVRRAESADRLAHASAEVGVLFTGLTIATGSIWGKPTWGTWWTWDARLTSVSILFVMYLGYLLLRGMIDDREARRPIRRRARHRRGVQHSPRALLGLLVAHPAPAPVPDEAGTGTMPGIIVAALLVNFAAFTLLYVYFVTRRARLLRLEAEAEA